ncbi:hypothetical protein Trydic_g20030 [Trypoxylus dichotomus]
MGNDYQANKESLYAFLDIKIGQEKSGRIILELFKNIVPKTVENFRALCTGEKGNGLHGKPLHFRGSMFHRDQPPEDDCCPDWCENRRVKGRFGLAFVAETPCCCPEPIGWQVEFCDTPSKVEQRCKEMVQWANCPPLPRCEPCPPVEVCSPCFPPRCNPCCPLTNPCPPRCPPRCCPCPRPPSPKRKFHAKECCCQASKPKKCCCSVVQKRKSKCCRCENDEDEEEDEPYCPCKKSGKGKKKRDRSKRRDDDRGDKETDRESSQRDASFFGDEVPVKERQPHHLEYQVDNSRPDSTPYTKGHNEEYALVPLAINENEPENVVDYMDCAPLVNDTRMQQKSLEDEFKNMSITEKNLMKSEPKSQLSKIRETDFVGDINEERQENIEQYSAYLNGDEAATGYVYHEPSLNYANDNIFDLYNQDRRYTSYSSDNLDEPRNHPKEVKRRRKSRNEMPKRNTSFDVNNLSGSLQTPIPKSSKLSHMGRYTAVYSNIEAEMSNESVLVKRRRWLPYEVVKLIKRKFGNLFRNDHSDEDDEDDESTIFNNVRDPVLVPQFMVQCGDIVNFNGSGGESIYGNNFDDENFNILHTTEGIVGMANSGPNTNSSQFYITTVPCTHLDGRNVAFGKVRKGLNIIREIQELPRKDDMPLVKCIIENCGVLLSGEPWNINENDGTKDTYPPYPDDWDIDINKDEDSEFTKAITNIKDSGNHYYYNNDYVQSERKYKKSLRYIDYWLIRQGFREQYVLNMKVVALLNLAAVKLKRQNYYDVIKLCTEVISFDPKNYKALYRRGQANMAIKDYKEGLRDFRLALKLQPNNKVLQSEVKCAKLSISNYTKKERELFSKMF